MSRIYSAFQLIEDVIEYKNNGGKCNSFQFFISDPSRLRIIKNTEPEELKREVTYIKEVVKQYKIEDFIIHGSYMIGEMTKPYQLHILKQELGIAERAGASAYIVHAHSAQQIDLISAIRPRFNIPIVLENTSYSVNEEDMATYKRKLIQHPVVIDTAHLYSSGLAQTSDQMLAIIKSAFLRKTLFAVHFNDQDGGFARGFDRHSAIGIGKVFFQYPDYFFSDSELLAYVTQSCKRTVLEFTSNADYEYIYVLMSAFASSKVMFDKTRFVTCGAVVQAISEFLDPDEAAYQYRKLHYQAVAAQLIEIGEKESLVSYNDRTWKLYRLDDRVLGFLFFAILVQKNRAASQFFQTKRDMYAPQLSASQDYRIPLNQATALFKNVCADLHLKPNKNAFICGSVRRECSKIGDIDILVITPKDQREFAKLILHRIEESQIVEYQHVAQQTESIYMDNPPMILRLRCAGVNIDMYFALEEQKPTMLIFLTGNKYFNISMRALAKRKGFKLSGYDLYKGQKKQVVRSEEDVFKKLGIPYISPRYRSMWLGSSSTYGRGLD